MLSFVEHSLLLWVVSLTSWLSGIMIDEADHNTAYRALQNPGLFTNDHYRQAALAVAAGIAIRILVAIPVSYHE